MTTENLNQVKRFQRTLHDVQSDNAGNVLFCEKENNGKFTKNDVSRVPKDVV
jgi:hypothetical protein